MFTVILICVVYTVLIADVSSDVVGENSVVDLSHWNANVNFTQAKADGILGVMHKATQGLTYNDPSYAQRKLQAVSAGIKWGAYHFADGTSGQQQAYHFLKVVGNDPDTLLALDLEQNPGGSSVNLTIAEDFVKVVYEARKRYPLVYGSAFLKNMVLGTNSVLLQCPLWIAQWGPNPVIPNNTWHDWTLWQYTDGQSGPTPHSVAGIGHCDRDTVNTAQHRDTEDMWKSAGYVDNPPTTPAPVISTTRSRPSCAFTPSTTRRTTSAPSWTN